MTLEQVTENSWVIGDDETVKDISPITQEIGDWVVTFEWNEGIESGGPSQISIKPKVPGSHPVGGLSSTLLRKVDFKKAIDQLSAPQTQPSANLVARAKIERSLGVTPMYLAILSLLYDQWVGRGQASVIEGLSAALGFNVNTVRGHLHRARKLGYLTGAPGKKDGKATELSLRTIAESSS